ncbi:uncharacterized protein [Rutidosis leptorrhynchoides]|uniref:uncharacterized protein n=1 Tax=Rutidosis leptorrhynchoides TaxID=125765 RepID=UPI003A99144A
MGFGQRWRKWIHACLSSAAVSILVNGSPTKEFALQKGVRQGDPLSPYLFTMVAEGLNHLTKLAASHDRRNVQNLTKILKCFESTSGLKINFHKSCVYGLGVSKSETENMAAWLGYVAGTFPITYMGLLLGSSIKKSKAWDPVFDKFGKRLADWKTRSLSYGGRLTLIKAISDGSSTRFWGDYWVGDCLLKDKFNRLFRLDSNKDATVLDRVHWEGTNIHTSWCWSRDISGRLVGDLTNLTNLLSSFVPCSSGREEWSWSWSKDWSFSVKKLTDLLIRANLPNTSSCIKTLRNFLVPLKVELFIWRTRHKRLPTRVKLDKRGMDLSTVRCPVCDNGLESVDHSIILCSFAFDVWSRVFDWWNLGFFSNMSINKAFLGNDHTFTTDVGKQLWQAPNGLQGIRFGRIEMLSHSLKLNRLALWSLKTSNLKVLNGSLIG